MHAHYYVQKRVQSLWVDPYFFFKTLFLGEQILWGSKFNMIGTYSYSPYLSFLAIHVRRGCAGQGSGGILRVHWNCAGEESNLLNCSMVENDGIALS